MSSFTTSANCWYWKTRTGLMCKHIVMIIFEESVSLYNDVALFNFFECSCYFYRILWKHAKSKWNNFLKINQTLIGWWRMIDSFTRNKHFKLCRKFNIPVPTLFAHQLTLSKSSIRLCATSGWHKIQSLISLSQFFIISTCHDCHCYPCRERMHKYFSKLSTIIIE